MKADLTKNYKAARKAAYPTIEEQLDILYHQGTEAWKAAIEAVKKKYPKKESIGS